MVGSCPRLMVACPCVVAASHTHHPAAIKEFPCLRVPSTHLDHRDLSLLCGTTCLRDNLSLPAALRPVSSSSPALAGGLPGKTLIKTWLDPHGPGSACQDCRTARAHTRFRAMPRQHGRATRSQSKCVRSAAVRVGKRQAGSSYCTCTLDQPGPARDDGLIQTRFVARVGCGMPRQHFRRIGSPPCQAINQGLTLHLDIAASLVQNFSDTVDSSARDDREELSTGKEKKRKEGPYLPE